MNKRVRKEAAYQSEGSVMGYGKSFAPASKQYQFLVNYPAESAIEIIHLLSAHVNCLLSGLHRKISINQARNQCMGFGSE